LIFSLSLTISAGTDSSTGTLTPLYDRDTDLVFLMGKGDSVIRWGQIENIKVQEFPAATIGDNILGSCLIPKKACSIMSGEINRILVISGDGSNMIPVSVVVPRKSYTDFHSDVFPDTLSDIPNTSAAQWEQDLLNFPNLISLDPTSKIPVKVMVIKESEAKPSLNNGTNQIPKPVIKLPKSSTYRFIEGKIDVQYKDINNLNANNSNECNGFEVNVDVLAFSLNGAGGRVGIWLTKDAGRVTVIIPSVICGN
jgi:coronin-7